MSNLARSEGLVLRTRPFRESSKIASVLTRRNGRADFLARGARKPGSRFGAALEPGTIAELIYYERENANLWTLSSADIVTSHQAVRENPESLVILAKIIKLLLHVSHPGETNTSLYNLTLSALHALEENGFAPWFYDLYLWRAAAAMGYPARLDEGCMVCGLTEGLRFSVAQGGFLCPEHVSGYPDAIRLDAKKKALLGQLSDLSLSQWSGPIPPVVSKLIRYYVRYHLHTDEQVTG